jgi:hypothetical protein
MTKFNPDHHQFLHGVVTGHPRIQEGHRVFTSDVTALDTTALTATTLSGTEYTLGTIAPEYAEFLKEQNNAE